MTGKHVLFVNEKFWGKSFVNMCYVCCTPWNETPCIYIYIGCIHVWWINSMVFIYLRGINSFYFLFFYIYIYKRVIASSFLVNFILLLLFLLYTWDVRGYIWNFWRNARALSDRLLAIETGFFFLVLFSLLFFLREKLT